MEVVVTVVYRVVLCSDIGLLARHSHYLGCITPSSVLDITWLCLALMSPILCTERSSHFQSVYLPLLYLFGSSLPYSRWLEVLLPVCL